MRLWRGKNPPYFWLHYSAENLRRVSLSKTKNMSEQATSESLPSYARLFFRSPTSQDPSHRKAKTTKLRSYNPKVLQHLWEQKSKLYRFTENLNPHGKQVISEDVKQKCT